MVSEHIILRFGYKSLGFIETQKKPVVRNYHDKILIYGNCKNNLPKRTMLSFHIPQLQQRCRFHICERFRQSYLLLLSGIQ